MLVSCGWMTRRSTTVATVTMSSKGVLIYTSTSSAKRATCSISVMTASSGEWRASRQELRRTGSDGIGGSNSSESLVDVGVVERADIAGTTRGSDWSRAMTTL